jgi:hypothetical protein
MSRMKTADWKVTAEFLGMAAVVASLVFVGLELRQSQQVALNEAAYTAASWYFETRAEVNANAEVWSKGNAGEQLSAAEIVIYQNLIRNAHTNAFWNWATLQRVGMSGRPGVADFAGFLFKYPPARKVWESLRAEENLYRDALIRDPRDDFEFSDQVRADLKTLDALGTNGSIQ